MGSVEGRPGARQAGGRRDPFLTKPRRLTARRGDPETSQQAAREIAGKAGRVERLVMQAFGELGGRATAFQIVEQVKLRHPDIDSNTLTPRLKPLESKGMIARTDEKGPGRNGQRRQIVWKVL